MKIKEEVIAIILIILLLCIMIFGSIYTVYFDLARKAGDNLYINAWINHPIDVVWIITLQLATVFGLLNAFLQFCKKPIIFYIWLSVSLLSLILLLHNN